MRAIAYGMSIPQLQTRAMPKPQSHQVLVKVHAAGLNPVDAKYVIGDKLPSETLTNLLRRVYVSHKIPGFDFSGTVVQASNGFRVGDAVFGTVPPFCGSLAEYIAAPMDQVYYKPKSLSFPQAAALPLVGLTALQCLEDHVVPSSSHVLVIGASGGTGHVAVQVAKALGAAHVTAVCSPRSAQFCRDCGADDVLDYHKDLVQELRENGRQYDIVMDCVTSADPRDTAPHYYPRLLQQSPDHKSDKIPSWLAPNYIYRRLGGGTMDWVHAGLERTVGLNCWNEHEKLFWIRFPKTAGELKQLAEWADQKKLVPSISKTVDLSVDGVKDGMDAIMERRVHGKVVVNVLN